MDFKAKMDDIFKKPRTFERVEVSLDLENVLKEIVPEIPTPPVLYNIHKRSLPVELDTAMAWNFTKEQAERFMIKHLKVQEVIVGPDGKAVVYYYDIVRADGTDSGLFHNGKPVIKEGSDV